MHLLHLSYYCRAYYSANGLYYSCQDKTPAVKVQQAFHSII